MRRVIATAMVGALLSGPCHAQWERTGEPVKGTLTVKNEGNMTLVIDKTEHTISPTDEGHVMDGYVQAMTDTKIAVGISKVTGYDVKWEGGEKDDHSWGMKVTRKSDGQVAHLSFGSIDTKEAGAVGCGGADTYGKIIPTEYGFSLACWTKKETNKLNFHVGVGTNAKGLPTPAGSFQVALTGAVINK
ncbi:hypothetical protein [Escherichia coli]|uniref:hypothetical protein n=1 Tax=Escherichia coli TaxID=562 RepID=UPI00135EDD42|nr:hypothetical protein [Escherichia coli]MXF08841.1 hypothetical protein [Escherichia coli]